MKAVNPNFAKFLACTALVVGLSASASASCGDSMSAMAAEAASIRSQSHPTHPDSASPGDSDDSSIVGLWHIQFLVGTQTIQEAYQLWNVGGTEVHNPNVDPRSGNVCLGVWKRNASGGTYKLAHRVWNYDTNGTFMGTINLSETVSLAHHGTTHSGSFTLDFYDPSGNLVVEVAGSVVAERISVQ